MISYEERIRSLTEEIVEIRKSRDSLEIKLKKVSKIRFETEALNKTLELENARLSAQAKSVLTQNLEFKERFSNIKSKRENLVRSRDELQMQCEQMHFEINDLRMNLEKSEEQRRKLRNQVKQLTSSLSEQFSEIETRCAQTVKAESLNQSLRVKIFQKEAQIEE